MKKRQQENSRKRIVGLKPAALIEAFIIGLVACLLVFGKCGVLLLNAAKNLLDR